MSGIRFVSTALIRSAGRLITTAVGPNRVQEIRILAISPAGCNGIIENDAYGIEFDDFVFCPEMAPTDCNSAFKLCRLAGILGV